MNSTRLLAIALLALAVLFGLWAARGAHLLASLLVLVLPPLLLALAAWRGWPRAGFVAGVFALLWFSHGVMVAWTRPPERLLAWLEIALSLLVIGASSWPGLQARFGGRRGT